MRRHVIALCASLTLASVPRAWAQIPVTDVLRNVTAEIHHIIEEATRYSQLIELKKQLDEAIRIARRTKGIWDEATAIKDRLSGPRKWAKIRDTILDQAGRAYLPDTWDEVKRVIDRGDFGGWPAAEVFAQTVDELQKRYELPGAEDVFSTYPDSPAAAFYGESRTEAALGVGMGRQEYEKAGESVDVLNDLMRAGRHTEDAKDSLDYLGRVAAFAAEQQVQRRRSQASMQLLMSQDATRRVMGQAHRSRIWSLDASILDRVP